MGRITYRVVVDPDVNFSLETFRRDVGIYLTDPDGWERKGHEFVETKTNPDMVVHMSSPAGLRKVGCDPKLNCAELGGKHLRVNALLWTGKAPNKSGQDMNGYRQYVISHEVGHILGLDHAKCPTPGAPAPVMLQQTLGLHGCKPNTNV